MQVGHQQRSRFELVYYLQPRHPAKVLTILEIVQQETVQLEVSHCEVKAHCLRLPPPLQFLLGQPQLLSLQIFPNALALLQGIGDTLHRQVLRPREVEVDNVR